MKRRITAVILGITLLFIQAFPVGVLALETPDYSDYVTPTERTDNLIANNTDINLYKAVNSEVVTIDSGETSSEVNFIYKGDGNGTGKWSNFSYYGTEGTWAKSTGGGAGQTSGFNGYYPAGPESFVVEMQIRNAAPNVNANPEFTFSVFTDRAEGVAEKQIVPVTETENWQTVKTVFHTDKVAPSSMWIALGYGGTSSTVFPAIGTTIALYKPSLYVAIERAHEITLTSGSSLLLPGNSMELKAHVVNQLGMEGNLEQDFTWIALNADRTAVADGFSFAEGEDGKVTVTAGDSVPAGKYVILASHNNKLSIENGVRKGIDIVVPPYFMHDSEPGADPLYEVKLTADTDTTLGIFDKLNITAALVDSNGDKGTNEQSFDWYVLNEERTEKLADSGVNLVLSEDSASAEVSLDIDVSEGTYCIVAESKAAESKGMLRGLNITVDKSGIVSDIVKSIGEDAVTEIENNIETYVQILEITDDYVAKADKSEFCNILKDGIGKETIEDKADLQDYFRRAALTALFNIPSGDIALFDEKGLHNYEEELRIDKIDSKDLGTTLYAGAMSEMSDDGKAAYRASVTGKDFATYGDLYDAICKNLLLITIANPKDEGTAYLDTVITKPNLALLEITADEYFALNEAEFKSFKKTYLEKKTFDIDTLASTLKLAADYKLDDDNTEEEEEEKQGGNKVTFGGGSGGGSNKKDESNTADEETDISEKSDLLVQEFTDVPATHWARAEIHFLKNIGVVNGITDTSYMPDAFVTREQFLKLIIEAFDLSASGAEITFDDVKEGAWYSTYVMTGVQKGIVNGQSSTVFGIGKSITREDACVMIDRALSLSADNAQELSFKDSDKISDYAKNSVSALASYGIISGVGLNEFNPEGICTRAQAAKIIAGAINVCNSLGIGR